MAPYADLGDDEFFPSWSDLPFSTDTHFCFLAEIQHSDGFLRHRTIVKDREGAVSIVAFYPEAADHGFDFRQLKKGHTLAIMYALQHGFLDGTHGVRVEDMAHVCVFPMDLKALQNLGPEVARYAVDGERQQWKCHGCDASKPIDKLSRCSQCKVYTYCSKECQAKGWTEKGHKSSCKVLRGPNFLPLLKLDFSSSSRSNPFTFQRR